MPILNETIVDDAIARIAMIPDDATPRWGTLDKQGMIEHLIWAINLSLNTDAPPRFIGNVVTRTLVKPLLLKGLIPIPKGTKFPEKAIEGGTTLRMPGGVEQLRETLLRFLHALVDGTPMGPIHPLFGSMKPTDWAQLHSQHMEHHLKQFGV